MTFYIISIADAIKSNLRENDFAYRYGGYEIVIILQNCDTDKSEMIIKRINNSIERKQNECNKNYTMSISVGTASLFPKEPATSDDLIILADNRMYEEKLRRKGK